jgi:nucleotide-binding universal stress UspA family protein
MKWVIGMIKEQMKILVGIDGSDHSMLALKEAIRLAKKFVGSITMVTVYTKENEDEVDRIHQDIHLLLEGTEVDYRFLPILGSNPSRALIDMVDQEKFDLVVVGSRGLGRAAAFLLGSVSIDVVSKTSCDVLVVK